MTDLTLDQARQVLDAAIDCAAERILAPLAIAVLDAGGHLRAFVRQDGSGILRPQIAVGKAWGALGMGTGTRALKGKSPEFLGALAAMSGGRVVPSPGGVLIREAGEIVGAVGISGDTGDNDEACALAAVRAVGLEPDGG